MAAQQSGDKRVLIAAGLHNSSHDDRRPTFLDLIEPHTGQSTNYMLTRDTLQECILYQPRCASWFVGDSVVADGSLHMCTPVDVLFILLPALDKAAAAGTFCDLEQCLESLGSPHAHRLVPLLSNGQLECICDAKEAGGARYYRLNEAKALAWLRLKVEKTKAALIASSPQFGSLEDTALTVYAAGILGEYMTKDWSAKLATALNLPSEMQAGGDGIKALAPQGYNPDLIMPSQDREAKKPRLDPAAAAKAKALEARQAAKAAKLAKEAAGMRKLSSFFTKKG